ncbi:hypothetical protein [Intestinibacillus massiliensis]|uniref:hypothetical protein n=1 Tax=Intestinibacillus massiliensis TaxID=1871029 RepID=UPI000B34CEA5|nr:hypothetical protein [Intestinibacillus massiliensis]
MTAKEWLMRARKQEERIIALQGSKQRAYDRAVSTTARPREVCVISGGKAAPDEKNAAYIELCEEIDRQIDELNRIRAEILHVIRGVQDSTLATLLIEYYINSKTWEQVAVAIHYSYSDTVQKKHPKALRTIEQIVKVNKK